MSRKQITFNVLCGVAVFLGFQISGHPLPLSAMAGALVTVLFCILDL